LNNPYTAPTADIVDMSADETYQPTIFSLSGRIGRLRYIGYTWLISLIVVMVGGVLAAIMIPMFAKGGNSGMFYLIVIGIYGPAIATHIIMAIRRLNDLDQTGWLSILALVPFVNFFFGLYLIFAPGTQGRNRFGAAPSKHSYWIVIVLLFIPVFLIGILAAIAIPAYQDYTKRARALQTQSAPAPQEQSDK